MRRALRRFAAAVIVLACAAGASGQDLGASGSAEQLIKAGYIYNFAKLVEWPESPVLKGQPIVIGVLGNQAFAAVLRRVVDGKKIDDRPLHVKPLKSKGFKDCGCQILFVAASESGRADEIIRFQNTASVLTIAETPDFARQGGIVALVLEDSKVRFMVNVDAAAQAALTISSRLLALATIVHTSR
jgi:hypothetical protein